MWVCRKCSVNAYSDTCPMCGLTESEANPDAPAESEGPAACPLCGNAAERGCVYGSDKGWRLRWYGGPAGFWGNLTTGLGGGDPVGSWGFGTGPYAAGIRCDQCKRIILEY